MTEPGVGSRLERRVADEPDFVSRAMWVSALFGLLAAAVGIVAGIAMATHSFQVTCPDGHFVPNGGDPNCYSYPYAGTGVGLVVLSIIGAALIVLACTAVVSLAAVRREVRWVEVAVQ